MTWVLYAIEGHGLHIIPEDELNQHRPEECTCGAEFDEECAAVVHNSFDGREAYETGERKLN